MPDETRKNLNPMVFHKRSIRRRWITNFLRIVRTRWLGFSLLLLTRHIVCNIVHGSRRCMHNCIRRSQWSLMFNFVLFLPASRDAYGRQRQLLLDCLDWRCINGPQELRYWRSSSHPFIQKAGSWFFFILSKISKAIKMWRFKMWY